MQGGISRRELDPTCHNSRSPRPNQDPTPGNELSGAAVKTSHSQIINIKKIKTDFLTLPVPHNPVLVVSLCSTQTGKGVCFSTCLHGWPGYLLWPTECSRINLAAQAWKGFLCFTLTPGTLPQSCEASKLRLAC